MKKIAFTIFMFGLSLCVMAQSLKIDSLKNALKNDKTDTGKIITLYNLSAAYIAYKPDTALLIGQEALAMSKKIKFLRGESWSYNDMALAFNAMGNYTKGLQYYIEQLKIEETKGYPDNIAQVNMQIATVYEHQEDYEQAMLYANVADSIINANLAASPECRFLKLYALMYIGDIYEKSNKLDSALFFTNKAAVLAASRKDTAMIADLFDNLGNIYAKSGQTALAFKYFHDALPLLEASKDEDVLCEASLGLANLYERNNRFDSAEYFGKQSFGLSQKDGFQERLLNASSFLSDHYKKANKPDSAFKYLELMVTAKDTINSRVRIRQLQIISTNEQLRQQELIDLKQQERRERSQKLQLLAIGILIPTFFVITIFLSRKRVHSRVIKFSGIISLLFLFEYLTLLLHPFVAEKTNDTPLLEILILVAIAAILIPSHHRIEHWLLERLSSMNRSIHQKLAHVENDGKDDTDTKAAAEDISTENIN